MDLSLLGNIKNKSSDKRKDNSINSYIKGQEIFQVFIETKDVDLLREASVLFLDAIAYNKDDYKPYLSLGYVFYLLENNEFALKYFDKAESLTNLPEEVKELKNKIESNLAYERNPVSLKVNNIKPIEIKTMVNKKSNFWKFFF
ncbi:MAG: hypothetical protein U0457_04210 [Candidatus Sericytochromatia bacterium]